MSKFQYHVVYSMQVHVETKMFGFLFPVQLSSLLSLLLPLLLCLTILCVCTDLFSCPHTHAHCKRALSLPPKQIYPTHRPRRPGLSFLQFSSLLEFWPFSCSRFIVSSSSCLSQALKPYIWAYMYRIHTCVHLKCADQHPEATQIHVTPTYLLRIPDQEFAWIRIYTYSCTNICMCMYICRLHVFVYAWAYIYVCIYVYIYIFIFLYMHTYIHVCICVFS